MIAPKKSSPKIQNSHFMIGGKSLDNNNACLSVVTITFNDYDGLVRTSQTIDDTQVEWIVIDGSNSELVKAQNAKLLQNRNVKLIQESDRGRFHAMNKGLDLSNGNLICFMNSGDQFATKEVSAKVLDSWNREKWVWAVGGTIAVNDQGIHQWRWPMPNHKSYKLRLGLNSYCHQSTVYEKKFLKELDGFYENSLYSDWLTSLLLSQKSEPFISDDLWALFLVDGISSQQSLEYWSKESIRLRKLGKVKIGKISIIDFTAQNLMKFFLQTRRGRLIRTDLVRKYPI
jgi:glycosyltransferase involved in cell wall biosynthesis